MGVLILAGSRCLVATHANVLTYSGKGQDTVCVLGTACAKTQIQVASMSMVNDDRA